LYKFCFQYCSYFVLTWVYDFKFRREFHLAIFLSIRS